MPDLTNVMLYGWDTILCNAVQPYAILYLVKKQIARNSTLLSPSDIEWYLMIKMNWSLHYHLWQCGQCIIIIRAVFYYKPDRMSEL